MLLGILGSSIIILNITGHQPSFSGFWVKVEAKERAKGGRFKKWSKESSCDWRYQSTVPVKAIQSRVVHFRHRPKYNLQNDSNPKRSLLPFCMGLRISKVGEMARFSPKR